MEFTEVNNKRTYRQIIEQFMGMIERGEIKPGDKLPGERELAEKLGSSRPSVREAFRTLEILGVIEVRHGGGTFIREFNVAPFINMIAPLFYTKSRNIEDLTDFRILLEGEAVKAAALSHNDSIVGSMETSLELMNDEDPRVREKADLDFHRAIFAASGNRTFVFAGECLSYILYASVHLNREVIQGKDDMAERWAEDHRRILDAVSAGDPEAAYNALKSHLESVGSYLTENKNEQGGK